MKKYLSVICAALCFVGVFASAQYAALVYHQQGGSRLVAASGGSIDIESGGELDIESGGSFKIAGTAMTASAAELSYLDITAAGTLQASKAVVVNSSSMVDNLDVSGCYKMDNQSEYCSVDTTISSANVKTLNQYCPTLVAAPGAGYALVLMDALFYLDYGAVAYDTIATIDELSIKYTSSAGAEVARIEATGFLDQTSDQIRYTQPDYIQVHEVSSSAVGEGKTPAANAPLCLNMLNSEVATGDGPLKVRVWYKVVPTSF